MRLFHLENETGDRLSLNNETGIFLSNPEGLGIDYGGTFADIDNGFFKYAAKKYVQKSFSATLNFMVDPYELYRQFIDWCMASNQISLVYNPHGTEYYVDVEIESIDKREINKLGYLATDVKFKILTPWYLPTNQVINSISEDHSYIKLSPDYDISQGESGNGSTLDGPTDVLASGFAERFSIELGSSTGHFPSGFLFTYTGAAYYPVFILEDLNTGEEIGRCAILNNFANGSIIEFSTKYQDSYVKGKDVLGNEVNLINYVDISTDPFFRIPIGTECKFKVQDDGAINGTLKCVIYDYFRSV